MPGSCAGFPRGMKGFSCPASSHNESPESASNAPAQRRSLARSGLGSPSSCAGPPRAVASCAQQAFSPPPRHAAWLPVRCVRVCVCVYVCECLGEKVMPNLKRLLKECSQKPRLAGTCMCARTASVRSCTHLQLILPAAAGCTNMRAPAACIVQCCKTRGRTRQDTWSSR